MRTNTSPITVVIVTASQKPSLPTPHGATSPSTNPSYLSCFADHTDVKRKRERAPEHTSESESHAEREACACVPACVRARARVVTVTVLQNKPARFSIRMHSLGSDEVIMKSLPGLPPRFSRHSPSYPSSHSLPLSFILPDSLLPRPLSLFPLPLRCVTWITTIVSRIDERVTFRETMKARQGKLRLLCQLF